MAAPVFVRKAGNSCRMYSYFFFSSRRRHTRCSRDWSSDVCSSDLARGRLRSSRDILRAVVVGLPHFDLADADAIVVEAPPELLAEVPGELLGGGVALPLPERLDVVDVQVIEAAADFQRHLFQLGEIQHVAGAVQFLRLRVDQDPVVVAVQGLALGLREAHLVRRAEPELLADAVHAGAVFYAASSTFCKNPQRTRIFFPCISSSPRRVKSFNARETVSREVPISPAISCCVGRSLISRPPSTGSPCFWARSRMMRATWA